VVRDAELVVLDPGPGAGVDLLLLDLARCHRDVGLAVAELLEATTGARRPDRDTNVGVLGHEQLSGRLGQRGDGGGAVHGDVTGKTATISSGVATGVPVAGVRAGVGVGAAGGQGERQHQGTDRKGGTARECEHKRISIRLWSAVAECRPHTRHIQRALYERRVNARCPYGKHRVKSMSWLSRATRSVCLTSSGACAGSHGSGTGDSRDDAVWLADVPIEEPLTATPQVRTGVGQGSFRKTRPRECPVKGRQPEHPYDPAGAPQVGGHVGLELRGMPPCAAPIAGWLTSCADALFK